MPGQFFGLNIQISIHAPARGATGADGDFGPATKISIHAPARGATSFGSCYFKQYLDFNPRSREGSDSGIAMEMSYSTTFQSTLPRGERLYTIIAVSYTHLTLPTNREV